MYRRVVKTGEYNVKPNLSPFLRTHVLRGEDCGTERTIEITIPDDITAKQVLHRYIVEGEDLIELTADTMESYKGKTVNMRSAIMCDSKAGVCNICFGNFNQ